MQQLDLSFNWNVPHVRQRPRVLTLFCSINSFTSEITTLYFSFFNYYYYFYDVRCPGRHIYALFALLYKPIVARFVILCPAQ